MRSWKEDNMLKKLREYTEDGFYDDDDEITDVYAEGIRDTLNSEYEFIQDLMDESGLDYYDDSDEEATVLAYESSDGSTYRFYFDENDQLFTITEIMKGTNATKSNPDMGIWSIDDFDVVENKKGNVFRTIVNYKDGDSIADIAIPMY